MSNNVDTGSYLRLLSFQRKYYGHVGITVAQAMETTLRRPRHESECNHDHEQKDPDPKTCSDPTRRIRQMQQECDDEHEYTLAVMRHLASGLLIFVVAVVGLHLFVVKMTHGMPQDSAF